METIKSANLALTFLLELCLLGAFALWGFATGNGLPMQIGLGIGVPLVVAIVWGLVMAPRAARRLKPPCTRSLRWSCLARRSSRCTRRDRRRSRSCLPWCMRSILC